MPPKFSKPGRTDHSASADFTPRGHRGQRGYPPRHEPRGGRQDHRQPRDPKSYEERNRAIDDAFRAPRDSVRLNSMIFAQCISQVLRKQGSVKDDADHDSALADEKIEAMSRHLAYVFRHTNLLHRDGSLSLHELLSHTGTARKIRTLFRDGMQSLQDFDINEVSSTVRDRPNISRFLMPLAHVVVDMNKARVMVACVDDKSFQPGIVPTPDSWFKLAEFGDDLNRESQADRLDGIDVTNIFIRFESGHSTNVSIEHCPFVPAMFDLRYLVHGTNEN